MKSHLISAYKEEHREVFNKRFGVIFNGPDNLRPLEIENLIDASPTATQCAWIYSSFIGGGGFEQDLSHINLSEHFWERQTPEDLLSQISESLSRHQGAFIHVGYNANFEKEYFKIIPYTLCRLGKKDSKGYAGKIVVSPNGWGRYLKKEEVDIFDTYNPRPEVIEEQVERVGGWENYKGQVLFFRLNDKHTYPKSLIEPAYLHADLEHHMGLFYNATVKKGFENTTFIRHLKFESEQQERQFRENIEQLRGVENTGKLLLLEDDFDSDTERSGGIRFDTLPNESRAEKYAHFEQSSANFIRKSFKNIPPQLVDFVQGKLGNTSGDDLVVAQSVYNSMIAGDRKKAEILFSELFRNYKEPITANWTIKQYALLEDGTVN